MKLWVLSIARSICFSFSLTRIVFSQENKIFRSQNCHNRSLLRLLKQAFQIFRRNDILLVFWLGESLLWSGSFKLINLRYKICIVHYHLHCQKTRIWKQLKVCNKVFFVFCSGYLSLMINFSAFCKHSGKCIFCAELTFFGFLLLFPKRHNGFSFADPYKLNLTESFKICLSQF